MKNQSAIPLLLLALLLLTGCHDINSSTSSTSETVIYPYGTGNVRFFGDYAGFNTIESLCQSADYIVFGYYRSDTPVSWNMSRNPNNPDEPSEGIFIEGLLYQFSVVESFKGNCSEVISVNLEHGHRQDLQKDGQITTTIYECETWYSPTTEEYTVLFLKYDVEAQCYYAVGYPFELTTGIFYEDIAAKDLTATDVLPLKVVSNDKSVNSWFSYCSEKDSITIQELRAYCP